MWASCPPLSGCREQYGDPVCVLDLVKRVERRPRESVLGQVGSGLACLRASLKACLLLATQAEVLVCAAHVLTPSWSAPPAQEFAAAVRFLNQRLRPGQDVQRVQYTAFGAPACCVLVAWSGWRHITELWSLFEHHILSCVAPVRAAFLSWSCMLHRSRRPLYAAPHPCSTVACPCRPEPQGQDGQEAAAGGPAAPAGL